MSQIDNRARYGRESMDRLKTGLEDKVSHLRISTRAKC